MARKKRHEYLTSGRIRENIQKYLREGSIYIPFCVASSKNSMEITWSFSKKRKVLGHSKAYNLYRDLSLYYYRSQRRQFLELVEGLPKPYKLGFHHICAGNYRWDHHNMMQGPADLMQEAGWIEDDDVKNVCIYPDGYEIDKYNQGLVITPYKEVTFTPTERRYYEED